LAGTIGTKVKRIRKLDDMSQVGFSSFLGISQGRLSEIEKDITKPSAEIWPYENEAGRRLNLEMALVFILYSLLGKWNWDVKKEEF
jgi:DNA-binding XRE family transcriptional regulator